MSSSNPILQSAIEYRFNPYSEEEGLDKIVAFGDASHKCPVYVTRTPPCSAACPAGEDIRGMHNILRGIEEKGSENRWEAAFYRLTAKNPFPFVMGEVCPAPCQTNCNRVELDTTVSINAVEHAIGKYGIDNNLKFKKPEATTGKKVAVVGSGPAGLSCAYQLTSKGHSVTIFESSDKLGGMMRYGTLGYRVGREELAAEINRITDLGMVIKTGVKIGVDISLAQIQKEYDATFLGVGAQKGRRLPVTGSDGTAYVTDTIEFLKRYEDNENFTLGKKVVVIGDGDVAMDVARLALRLGSEATIISGVPREEMNCKGFEFDEAMAEGAKITYLAGATEITRDGDNVTGLQLVKMMKKEKGEEGWNSPVPFFRYKADEGSEFTLDADMVVFSIGQSTDMTGLTAATNGKPWLNVDANLQIKGLKGVFGGGDAVSIALLTTAIGHGRKAAEAIDLYLKGLPLPRKERPDVIPFEHLKSDYFLKSQPVHRSHDKIGAVAGNFDTMLNALTEDQTVAESERCMSCGLCFECDQCKIYCPQEAIEKFKGNEPGEVMFTIYERCVGCHICAEVCPTGFIDMGMGE